MTNTSPFSLARFEYEPVHLYYLPQKFRILEAFKPTYVIGSRGTGKTTLLNALNWEQQLNNDELKRQLTSEIVDRRYVGLYLRAPRFQCDKFETWLSSKDKSLYAAIFSTYFDLSWIEVLTAALAELLAGGVLSSPTADEYATTRNILERFPQLVAGAMCSEGPTLKELSSVIRNRREELEDMALWKSPVDHAMLAEHYPLRHFGEFGRSVGGYCADFCNRSVTPTEESGREKWHFKVCLDEAEYLTDFQHLVVNSIVRLTSVPVSYVFAYVRAPANASETLLPNMSLQEADRGFLQLDSMDDAEFKELAEGAAGVRIGFHLAGPLATFQTRSVLGVLDINKLLYDILSESENPRAKDLLTRAMTLAESPFFRSGLAERSKEEGQAGYPPPIYQTYIIEQLGLRLPAPDTAQWLKRQQDSAEIRKRMVAAYLCICAELRQAPRYGSAEMVFQMSDKCVRDYLSQMNELFNEFGAPLAEFLTSAIPLTKQNRALKSAADKKRDFLPKSGISSPREGASLVDGLGEMTAKLQSMPGSTTALKSSERGVFSLLLSSVPDDAQWLPRLISEVAEAGYIKILCHERLLEFRMHCSLAAKYGFSYRGAYYKVNIQHSDLINVIRRADRKERSVLIASLCQSLDRMDTGTMNLFEL